MIDFAPTSCAILWFATSIAACPGSAWSGVSIPIVVPAFGAATLSTTGAALLIEDGIEIFNVLAAALPLLLEATAWAASARAATAAVATMTTGMRFRNRFIGVLLKSPRGSCLADSGDRLEDRNGVPLLRKQLD